MKLYIAFFSKAGELLAERIAGLSLKICYGNPVDSSHFIAPRLVCRLRGGENLKDWADQAFLEHTPLLFIGAMGIAVRAVAPFVSDKSKDSPVLVMDEKGQYVIPMLSGHLGGANELAMQIAEEIGAKAVLTTATDVHGVWAADVFARKNGLSVINKERISAISTRLLSGEKIILAIEGVAGSDIEKWEGIFPELLTLNSYDRKENADLIISTQKNALESSSLIMKPKQYILGIGCKRGISYGRLQNFVEDKLKELPAVTLDDVAAVASITRKADEEGLLEFSGRNRIPFYVFSGEELVGVEGKFQSSKFVEETVGVDNVCERAAIKASAGELVLPKQAENGMTLAVAKIPKRILYKRLFDGFKEEKNHA